jgi:rhomboid protease GluP
MKTRRPLPKVSAGIAAVCIAVFALIHLSGFSGSDTEAAILYGAYYKPFILAGEWWRLLSVGLVHVQLLHLMMNLFALYSLGMFMEQAYGRARYSIILAGSVLSGSLFLFILTGNTVAVGLSGGLYGLMAGEIYFIARSGAFQLPGVRNSILETVMINLGINFMPGVAWQAHVGGAVAGLLLAAILDPSPNPAADLFRRNSRIALIALCIAIVPLTVRNASIPSEERYLGTDARILAYESQHGLSGHAQKMAEKLDTLYGTDVLSEYLKEN